MKKSDIYEIAIKVFGLYLFFLALGQMRELLVGISFVASTRNGFMGDFNQTPQLMLLICHFVLVLVLAAFLTFKTKVIVKAVCQASDFEETSSLFADKKVIYEMALVIMGLLLVIWTLPDLVGKLKSYIHMTQTNWNMGDNDSIFIYTSLAKILVGVISFVYARKISVALIRINRSGNEE